MSVAFSGTNKSEGKSSIWSSLDSDFSTISSDTFLDTFTLGSSVMPTSSVLPEEND